jgi:uncharacterized protein YutE (UPF0331/DUF86 family)
MLDYDQEIITGLTSQLKGAFNLLEELSSKDLNALTTDPHLLSSAKYNFIVAIEAAIDICNHLISKNGYRVPEGYSDSFAILAEQGILSDTLVEEKLVKMARFRNRLVHQYWQIDSEYLHEILRTHLADFTSFLKEIGKSL